MTSLFICWNCGEKVEPGFCEKCGAEIKDPSAVEVGSEPIKNDQFIQKQDELYPLEKGNNDITRVIYLLVFVNIGFYIVTSYLSDGLILSDEMYAQFGSSKRALESGQYYVLLSSMFTHSSVLHLFFNMYWLVYLAFRLSEMGYTNTGLLGSYMIIGLAESYISAYLDPNALAVGASGAVFAWIGIYIAILRRRNNENWRRYLQYAGIYMVISLIIPTISFWGHLIGFLFGWSLGSLNAFDYFKKK